MDDARLLLIDESGNMTIIFSSENIDSENNMEVKYAEDFKIVEEYRNEIDDKVRKKKDMKDRHLFYLKDYLKTHYLDEFKKIGYDPQRTNDDLLLYLFLSEFGVATLINSSEHINIAFIPRVGMSDEQDYTVKEAMKLFPKDTQWHVIDDAKFVIEESNGQKYKIPDYGNEKRIIIGEYTDSEMQGMKL